VPCNAHLLDAIKTGRPAETSGEDNLKTMRLVYRAYESAARNAVIPLDADDCP
jgi:predicted dehydrogenase